MNNNLTQVLIEFGKCKFIPEIDEETIIPDEPGNYLICLKEESNFLEGKIAPTYKYFEDLRVLYTGIASKSLRKRDYRQHFKGHAGASTLRKSYWDIKRFQEIKILRQARLNLTP